MRIQNLESAHNPNYRRWMDLLESRGVKKHEHYLLFGEKVVSETLKNDWNACVEILLPPESSENDLARIQFEDLGAEQPSIHPRFRSINEFLMPHPGGGKEKVRVYQLTDRLFKSLDTFGTNYPILVRHVPAIEEWSPQPKLTGVEVFLATQDPANLGAAIRSCAAFGVSRVVLCKEAASPFIPKATRAASGSTRLVPIFKGPALADVIETLNAKSLEYCGLDMKGTSLTEYTWPKDTRLILGEEGRGLGAMFKGQTLSIPMAPGMESLNATISLSVALYSLRMQHPHSL